MCSKGKVAFGPIYDHALQALIYTLGPQCTETVLVAVLGVIRVADHGCGDLVGPYRGGFLVFSNNPRSITQHTRWEKKHVLRE